MTEISVIGGSGFIGTRLCEIIKGNEVDFQILDIVKSRSFPDHCVMVDITNLSDLTRLTPQCSTLINLAAEHRDNSSKHLYEEVNVEGARNICRVAVQRNIQRIVFTSSVAIYGFTQCETYEDGIANPFNDYGRSKWEAEQIYKDWQMEDPDNRSLVIVRPTVVFGERNRGNVFNLFRQIASGNFLMVGDGKNKKSLAYVDNVAAFLSYTLNFTAGIHTYNYVDKPDFTMNELVGHINVLLGNPMRCRYKVPIQAGLLVGKLFDLLSFITKVNFPISAIRVRKFCSNSVYGSSIASTKFIPPIPIFSAIEKTIRYEFLGGGASENEIFYSE
uniref:NAD-dependent epimerase/dehydratase family protein n=1 Tax=Polynucleobacter sp. TaxID=2029855 RepID=UPI0040479055